MRESALFGENLSLSRKIKTHMGANKLEIYDAVENNSPQDAGFIIEYHVN